MKRTLLFYLLFLSTLSALSAQGSVLRKVDSLPGSPEVFFYGKFLGELNDKIFYIANNENYNLILKTTSISGRAETVIQILEDKAKVIDFVVQNNRAYFVTLLSTTAKLWVSDGTELGTRMLQETKRMRHLKKWKNDIVFAEQTGGSYYLSHINSSNNNVTHVKKFYSGTGGLEEITVRDTAIYLICRDSLGKDQLAVMNGIHGAVKRIKDLSGYFKDGFGNNRMTWSDNKLFFLSDNTNLINSMWVSDGTEVGTILLRNNLPLNYGFDIVGKLGDTYNNRFFFNGFNGSDTELYVSDGTASGTKTYKDFLGVKIGDPVDFRNYKGNFYIVAFDPTLTNKKLWKVKPDNSISEVNLGNIKFIRDQIYVYKDSLLLVGYVKDRGTELFLSEGSTIKPITNGNNVSAEALIISYCYVMDSTIFMRAKKDDVGYELWAYGPLGEFRANLVVNSYIKCKGNSNGNLSAFAGGGNAPYRFLWSNGLTTENITMLGPGQYTVTVTSSTKEVRVLSVTLIDPPLFQVSTVVKDANPIFKNGSATMIATGGVPPYFYRWTVPVKVGATLVDLSPGTYKGFVSDSVGCRISVTLTVGASTNTNTISEHNEINIYPNPASEVLNVNLGNLEINNAELSIADVTGREIARQMVTDKNVQVNISSLTEGIYLLRLRTVNH
ncbi:MAG: T9SS type A sorting domain-containing protein [Saprospiraceae bacterium]